MRIAYPLDIQKKWDAIWPYIVIDGMNVHLSDSAPKQIREYLEEVKAYDAEIWQKEKDDGLKILAGE